ncbi:unnamed protein product, partial [Tilletia caries]
TLAKHIFSRFLSLTGSPAASLTGRTMDPLPAYPPSIGRALFDASTNCTFPLPVPNFDPAKYVGASPSSPAIWYQLASSSNHHFEEGCRCMYAKYAPAPSKNGSIVLENVCTRTNATTGEVKTSSVHGIAECTAAGGFGLGSYQVRLGPRPGGVCGEHSPNYVVSKVYYDDGELEGQGLYEAVIVGGGRDFEGWYLLSRQRDVPRSKIDTYLKDVASLGYDLRKPYSLAEQGPSCPEPTV